MTIGWASVGSGVLMMMMMTKDGAQVTCEGFLLIEDSSKENTVTMTNPIPKCVSSENFPVAVQPLSLCSSRSSRQFDDSSIDSDETTPLIMILDAPPDFIDLTKSQRSKWWRFFDVGHLAMLPSTETRTLSDMSRSLMTSTSHLIRASHIMAPRVFSSSPTTDPEFNTYMVHLLERHLFPSHYSTHIQEETIVTVKSLIDTLVSCYQHPHQLFMAIASGSSSASIALVGLEIHLENVFAPSWLNWLSIGVSSYLNTTTATARFKCESSSFLLGPSSNRTGIYVVH